MISLFAKTVDLGWGVLAVVLGTTVIGALAAWVQSPPTWSRAVRRAAVVVAGMVTFFICAGGLDNVGRSTSAVWWVVNEHERGQRLATFTSMSGKGGGSCLVRVFDMDGGYVAGSSGSGSCNKEVWGGVAVLKTRGGFFYGSDRVFIDLWTGRELGSLSELVDGEFRVKGTARDGVHIQRQDGTMTVVPWPHGSAVATSLTSRKQVYRDDLFHPYVLTSHCGGQRLLVHRSVAFGDGPMLLSALQDDARGPLLWTEDLEPHLGASQVLGAMDHEGQCLVIGAGVVGNLQLARIR